jgi:carbamoyltransferase
LEEDAEVIFNPGTPDPFMLFDHEVKKDWLSKLPGICHIDGTARLQTVNQRDNSVIHELLLEYKKLSGFGVLCNTSANLKGRGFFPDVESAMSWGKVDYVWCDYFIYHKKSE